MGLSCRPSYLRVWHACLLVNAVLLGALLLVNGTRPGRFSVRFQARLADSVGAGVDLLTACSHLSCAHGLGLCGHLVESAFARNETAGTSCSSFLLSRGVSCAATEPSLLECDGFYREVTRAVEFMERDAGGYVILAFTVVVLFLLLCAVSFEEYTRSSAHPEMRDAATWMVVGWLAAVRAASARKQSKPSPVLPSVFAASGTLVSIETQ